MKKPSEREFVVCKITKVNPNSAYAQLLEYDQEGIIHISEIARGWIKDIKKHLKPGQVVVAKVVSLKGGINLSIKRVDPTQEKMKLKEYKFDLKAERMLEISVKEANASADEKERMREKLTEEFGSLYEGFKIAAKKPDMFADKGMKGKLVESIKSVAKKNIGHKEFVLKAEIRMKSYKPGGVNIIKKALQELEKGGIKVRYISAPNYIATIKTKNAKSDKKIFTELIEKATRNSDIEGSYELK